MIHTIFDGVDGGMEIDVVVVFIDRSLLAFANLLARMARSAPVSTAYDAIECDSLVPHTLPSSCPV